MGRWRPPPPKSSPYITRAGFERLQGELDHLWRKVRPEVVQALAAAAAEGDRSENAEYTYRKKQLGEIDRRVRYLQKRLPALKIVDTRPDDESAIFFGAWFEIERASDGDTQRLRIVGPDETDAQTGWISLDSPMARAALKKRIDDAFIAHLPSGPTEFFIIDVTYDPPSAA